MRRPVAHAICFVILAAVSSSSPHFGGAWAQTSPENAQDSRASNRGPFSLVDRSGRPVTDRDFLGRYMLVFFGYTHCPDVCPTDLQVMSEAVELLGESGERVQPIFITIDPERDTVDVLARYVSHFHPRLVGLSGTPKQVAAAAQAYRVRYRKYYPSPFDDDRLADDASGEQEENRQYLMDHNAAIILVGPDGGGLSLYPHGMAPEEIAADIQRFFDD